MAIKTLESLRQHLQWAVEIEHSVIPPYLCALYSIQNGTNIESKEVVESVFMEEMLHMILAANALIAIGGKPILDHPSFIKKYPAYLPHSNEEFLVSLQKFSPEAVELFLKIEKPEDSADPPEDDHYHTFGQFYDAIEEGFRYLCKTLGAEKVFIGDPSHQVTAEAMDYRGSGTIIAVTDLESALAAMEEIIEQGEGHAHQEVWDGDRNMFHPEREEVGHYFRFLEIKTGRSYKPGDTPESGPTGEPFAVDWSAVHNMKSNPRSEDYPIGSEIRTKMDRFNKAYCDMLRVIERAMNGEPRLMGVAVGTMYELREKAIDLMQTPSGDGETTVGVSFDYMPRETFVSDQKKIIIRENGPYVVQGGIPLVHKSQVITEYGEPITWKRDEVIETGNRYNLCRCGKSSTKPFCDGTHALKGFNGTETADTTSTADLQNIYEEDGIVIKRDSSLCMEAGFCGSRFRKILDMVKDKDDTESISLAIAMVERCPSGSYTYKMKSEDEDIEPSLPQEIAVTAEGDLAGALWVTGNIQIERADGQPFETRNRVTLCRCGKSSNKPLCDGTHRELHIIEGELLDHSI